MDSRTFTTDDEGALATMFGDGSDENPESGAAIKRTAVRLATVFATLKARMHGGWCFKLHPVAMPCGCL